MVKLLLLLALAALLVLLTLLGFALILPILVRGIQALLRNRRNSGGASTGVLGGLAEIDRLIRPSVKHVSEVHDAVRLKKDDVSGD